VIVLEKTDPAGVLSAERSFRHTPLTERGWISGIYDGIETQTTMHRRLTAEASTMTFYDD
jgi:hypothetical protein